MATKVKKRIKTEVAREAEKETGAVKKIEVGTAVAKRVETGIEAVKEIVVVIGVGRDEGAEREEEGTTEGMIEGKIIITAEVAVPTTGNREREHLFCLSVCLQSMKENYFYHALASTI